MLIFWRNEVLNHFRWQLTADHNERPSRIQFVAFFLNSSVWHWIEIIEEWKIYQIYLKLRKYCNFETKEFIPAQEVRQIRCEREISRDARNLEGAQQRDINININRVIATSFPQKKKKR